MLAAATENRVIEVDTKRHLEALKGDKGGCFAIFFYRNFPLDPNKLLGGILFCDAGRLNQKDKGTCAAVHDRHFGRAQLDVGIINTQTRHCRQQVFDRVYLGAILYQGRGHGRLTDTFGTRRDLDHGVKINPAKHDTRVDRCRLQCEVDLLTRMQAHTSGPDDVFQCALSDHACLLPR